MKLSSKDIPAFLTSPAERSKALLIYGPDQGRVHERACSVRDAVLGKAYDPLCVIELTAEQVKADPARLPDEMSALSLLGGNRLILLRDAADGLAAQLKDTLAQIARPTAYLAVLAGDLGCRSSLRKLFETDKTLAALPCYRDDARGLAEVIRAAFREEGLAATPDAIQYLSAQLGGDRGVTRRELEKIALYMGEERKVTLEIAQTLVTNNSELALEDVSHAVAGGDIAALQSSLERHLQEGVAAIALLRAVARYFLQLQQAQAMVAEGASADEAAKRTRTFFKHIPALKNHLRRWKTDRLHQAQAVLLEAERDLKRSGALPDLLASRALVRVARLA